LVYGPLAHGLLSGGLRPDTRFAPGDWRATSPDFRGDAYQRNLAAVAALGRLARDELGVGLSQLAVAWTLANPAVEVAIVGTRNPAHIDDAIAAADIKLEPDTLDRIYEIMRNTQPTEGPSPEMMPDA
jgi:aryl-alcohol dehydrogenase-like predicted oxidoreductase